MKQSMFKMSGYTCKINSVPSEEGSCIYLCTITYPISGPYDEERRLDSNRTYTSENKAEQAGKAACINWIENQIR